MFVQIILSALCMQIVVASNVTAEPEYSNLDFDDFIPYLQTSVKDEIDWRLFKQFTSAKGHKNVIISPVSLKLVLALLYEGAAGNTKKEFQKILEFPADENVLRQKFGTLLNTLLVKGEKYTVNIGTRLFLDDRLAPSDTYQAKASAFYHTDIASTNFSNPHSASNEINEWTNVVTNGTIKKLVSPGDIENAVLLVTNAIYFKGMWSNPFEKNDNFEGGFHVSRNEIANVKYMQQVDEFYHYGSSKLGAEILRLPYKGKKFGIYFVLPYNKDDLSYLIDNLNVVDLTLSIRLLTKKPVKVILPKFKFDFQARFSNILSGFGFDTLFRGDASFPGIIRDQEGGLIVTDILQKSGIDVNEEGTVVYTATQVQLANKFGGQRIHIFNMSHPFMFFIEEQTTKSILFIGKVENPLAAETQAVPPRYGTIGDNQVPLSEPSTTYTTPIPVNYKPAAAPAPVPAPTPLDSPFDIKLLLNAADTSKNVLLSPASVKVSLAMLGAAATGSTANQIYNVLGISEQERHQVIKNLVNELSEQQEHSTLTFNNALFVSEAKRVKAQYEDIVRTYYKALVKQVNFKNRDRAAEIINSYVNRATEGFIPSVISAEEIDYYTDIMLTNVLYFKADWLKTFDGNLTQSGCFHSRRGCVEVQFMHIIDNFHYGETPNAHLVKLDYTGQGRAMLLVVPKSKEGLNSALKDLEGQTFKELAGRVNQTEVELILPKFKIDYNKNLVGVLQKMGIRQVFEANSNLSQLLEGSTQSKVDSFIHKTKVEVTEEGTEASAVSLVSVIPLMGSSSPKVRADHPFVFFIYNTQSSNILFEGILNEPEASVPEATTTKAFSPSYSAVAQKGRNAYNLQNAGFLQVQGPPSNRYPN